MSAYDLGTATGKVVIESDTTGLDDVNKKVKETQDKAEQSSINWDKAARRTAAAGLVIAGGLGVAVKSAADFEQGLSNIKAVSGATGDTMELVRGKAMQLGKDTKFSAGEAASAMEELAKAGIPLPDILNGAADATVALAAAGEVSLPEAATIASNAMNQFSLKAADMPKVADAIAGAANASAIDVSEFGQSLSQVGAVANLAGVSFEDTATAIALMGNAGIKGSDAGTSLKSMFQRLIPNTKEQKDLMAKLGIITKDGANQFFDAHGKLKSLAEVSQIMQTSLKGMTAEQKQATLTTLFGSDAIRAAAVLTKEGSKGFNEMAGAMAKVSAQDVAKTKMDNFNGSMEQLKGSLETAGITLGNVFLPAIRSVVDVVTEWINKFLSLDEGTQKTIGIVLAAVAGFLLLTAGMIKVVQFAQSAFAAFKMIGSALSFMSGANLKAAATWVTHMASLVAYQASLLWLRVQLAALAVWQGIVTAAQWLWNAAMSANPIGLIIIAIVALVAAILYLWNNNEGFRNFVIAAWEGIKNAVKAVGDWFVNTLWPALQAVWDGIVSGVKTMVGFVVAYWTAVFTAVTTVWNGIVSAVKAAVTFIWNLIVAYFNLYKAVITTVFTAVKTIITGIWNGIQAVIAGVVAFVLRIIQGWRNIIATVTGYFERVKDGIVEKWNAAIAWIKGVPAKILAALGNVGSILLNAGRKIIEGFLQGLKDKFESVKNFVGGIGSWIADHKGPVAYDVKLLVPNGKAIMDGFRKGIMSQMGPLQSDLGTISASLAPGITGPASRAALVAGGTQISNNSASTIVFNNYGLKNEQPSDANARQLRVARTVGMFG